MIRRYASDYHSIGVVYDEEVQVISYCSTCAAVGELSRLRERIYLDKNGKRLPDPPNADMFRQCWKCGNVVPLHEAKREASISGIRGVETVDSPFDNKAVILGNDSKHRYQRLKNKKSKHPDKEVQNLIEQGYELKSYESYMPQNPNE
jgi:hypothetical protein